MHSSIVTAIGTLKGPAHGGAAEAVQKMTTEIGDPARAHDSIRAKLDRRERIMGFGHRVYRAEDPRARLLARTAEELHSPRVETAKALEEAALAELQRRHPERVLATNVEYWAAVVLDVAQIPAKLTPAMFACARVAGWSAHILEQKRVGRLIRPSARYVGPGPRSLASLS
jgi:citrate synthase